MGACTRGGAFFLLLLVFLLFTYNTWWLAPVGSAIIILLSYLVWPGRNIDLLGLNIPLRQGLVSLAIASGVMVIAWLVLLAVTPGQDIAITPVWRRTAWLALLAHTLGQTLNEEMLLGALLLKSVSSRFRRLPAPAVSILVGLIFSLLHYAFYAFRPPQVINYGMLSLVALASIFAAGVLRNNCILSTGNIAFAWAIHFGWNVIFIDSSYTNAITHVDLSEPQMFNAVLGGFPAMLVVSLAAGLSFLLYRIYPPPVEGTESPRF